MLKVMTIVGTRPEIIKLSRVIAALEHYTQHVLVFTGQNYSYELSDIFFKELRIKPPHYCLQVAGENSAITIGNVIINVDDVLATEKPDAVVIYGDTHSGLAVIAAKRRKIPIFHLEAGNRCFDQRVPEEINRKIIDHISDVNLTISEQARHHLLKEGFAPDRVFKVGSPLLEIFNHYMTDIRDSLILEKLQLSPNQYLVVSLHREENLDVGTNLVDLLHALNQVAIKYNKKIIVSTHPRTKQVVEKLLSEKAFVPDERICFLNPLGFFDYTKLQMMSFCVLSDSGTITEEASILNFPAVTLREAHERPEGMEVGTLIMSGLNSQRILQSIDVITTMWGKSGRFPVASDYAIANFSNKIVKIIMSYTDYINRVVWQKIVV